MEKELQRTRWTTKRGALWTRTDHAGGVTYESNVLAGRETANDEDDFDPADYSPGKRNVPLPRPRPAPLPRAKMMIKVAK